MNHDPQAHDPQAEVLALLEDPATYGVTGLVTRIDTHAAAVFLAGREAMKLKRAFTLSLPGLFDVGIAQDGVPARDRGQPGECADDLPRCGADHA
ncbi:hypothetical protein [Breoghania sp.]|uniref:hypothetical protein n=1 Tax=Breoghania sp. TaxID=2065378 RepID=UPI00263112C9|nr:hypothetical protein [Breoghania sp.]MDJ0930107.1 hypothetical protein [Breoghania sp.]